MLIKPNGIKEGDLVSFRIPMRLPSTFIEARSALRPNKNTKFFEVGDIVLYCGPSYDSWDFGFDITTGTRRIKNLYSLKLLAETQIFYLWKAFYSERHIQAGFSDPDLDRWRAYVRIVKTTNQSSSSS